MTSLPTVSVIIPSYHRLHRLPPLIEAYLEQGADEIVVVLDGQHSGWRGVLGRFVAEGKAASAKRVRVVELPANRGLALARIAGLMQATGDVTLLTDDDVVPGPELLACHREFHGTHPNHVLMGYMPVDLPARRSRDESATFLYARDYETQVANWHGASSHVLLGSLWGGNISLRRELYAKAEDYKPSQRLNYNEDLDLGIRLEKVGAEAAFDPRARAGHQHQRNFAGFTAECVVRGEAVRDLELRWGYLPPQLVPLVRIPDGYRRSAAWVQRRIAARDNPGALERMLRLGYRAAGLLRLWPVQDAIARLMRRGLAMRGYRMRCEEQPG